MCIVVDLYIYICTVGGACLLRVDHINSVGRAVIFIHEICHVLVIRHKVGMSTPGGPYQLSGQSSDIHTRDVLVGRHKVIMKVMTMFAIGVILKTGFIFLIIGKINIATFQLLLRNSLLSVLRFC